MSFLPVSNRTIGVHHRSFIIRSRNKFGVSCCVFYTVHVAGLVKFKMGWSLSKTVFPLFGRDALLNVACGLNQELIGFLTVGVGG